jgi:outer membrane immunogenic protein
MKRLFITAMLSIAAVGTALAADLPQPMPAPQVPAAYIPTVAPVYNWGGIYLGINGGYGFGQSQWTDPANTAGSSGYFSANGGLVGGTVGANFQTDAFVFGIEGDIDWQSVSGVGNNPFCSNISTTSGGAASGLGCQTQSDWLGTIRARVGYAADRVLFYGTAGGAFGGVQTSLDGLSTQSTTKFGWTAGAGVEWALADNWTARVEYLYVDLGNSTCNTSASCGFEVGAPPTAPTNNSVSFTENIVRAGVDFKFR